MIGEAVLNKALQSPPVQTIVAQAFFYNLRFLIDGLWSTENINRADQHKALAVD